MRAVEAARRLLQSGDERNRRWADRLTELGPPDFEVTVPDVDDLPGVLLDLTVPHEDIDALVRLRSVLAASPELWWILERCVHGLVRQMGEVDVPDSAAGPALPPELGPLHRCFYVFVFVAMLPHVRAYHRDHGIPEGVTRATFTDLGRHMAVHRWKRGAMGLGNSWLPRHFRGTLYQLGRLQFERSRADPRAAQSCLAAGVPLAPGEPVLDVHVPEFSGALTPTACQASFAWAKRFFEHHFPSEAYRVATCSSWLLDEQLAEYLPATSNIVHFQRRFRPAFRPAEDDRSIMSFVFGRTYDDPADMPRRTTLERAIADHLSAGRHFHGGVGWLML